MTGIGLVEGESGINVSRALASLTARHESTTVCPRCSSPLVKRMARSGPNTGKILFDCRGTLSADSLAQAEASPPSRHCETLNVKT